MERSPKPRLDIAKKALPAPLLKSLIHIFSQGIDGCWLAGGTALAGFYAGHRRSDDLDFFTESDFKQTATVLAIKSLAGIGAKIETRNDSRQYYDGSGNLAKHLFKITSVLDANLFQVGKACAVDSLRVVDLETLFMMKAATLVSRCSEKDLYDLQWLFRNFSTRNVGDLILAGEKIDSGVNGEAMLISLSGASLSEKACDFSLDPKITAKEIHVEILKFRNDLIRALHDHLRNQSTPPLGKLIRHLKTL